MSWLKVDLPFKIKKPILAVGADIKNSICFAHHKSAFMAEVINDLEIMENFEKFKKELALIPKRFRLSPMVVAYDKHPEYFSTKYVFDLQRTSRIKLCPVQHHHAHIASCMAENKFGNRKVIGVAFDGSGFGDDFALWGAEFFVANYKNFYRAAHLKYVPLLGGKRAIYEPWRLTSAWLYLVFGDKFLNLNIDFIQRINKKNWSVLEKMYKAGFNSPYVSSIGRLFDAVAGLLLGIYKVGFEAEAAIKLEKLATGFKSNFHSYNFKVKKSGQLIVIDPALIFKEIISDLKNKINKKEIAARFHVTVANMVKNICVRIREKTEINTVILSGGVFQNKLLLRLTLELLGKSGFQILTHKILPCSDVSISVGQTMIAAYINDYIT